MTMNIYEKLDYSIKCNEAITDDILDLYPESIVNSRLRDHWRMFKSKNIGYNITINENILYQWCINKKIFAFSYALVEGSDKHMYSIFKVLEGENTKSMSDLLSHHYQRVHPIDPKVFNVPMFKFLPRKLELIVNVTPNDGCCVACKFLYDGHCLNIKCPKFKLPNIKHLTNNGPVQLSMEYVHLHVGVSPMSTTTATTINNTNATMTIQTNPGGTSTSNQTTNSNLEGCKQCLKCKLCSKNYYLKKCKRHIVCTHVKKKQIRQDFRKFVTNS